tara:strand:- start:17075 stop:17332 length:258 start_codon:yes stop_codon:yes gene_type:complete
MKVKRVIDKVFGMLPPLEYSCYEVLLKSDDPYQSSELIMARGQFEADQKATDTYEKDGVHVVSVNLKTESYRTIKDSIDSHRKIS